MGERRDVILEWNDDQGRQQVRLRDVEITTDDRGITQPIEHEGRTFGASHTYFERGTGSEVRWIVFRERRPRK